MPARPPLPPRRIPRRLARLGSLPEHEVERVVLRLVDLDALASAQVVERLSRQLAVAREPPHRVVHVAVVGRVRKPALRSSDSIMSSMPRHVLAWRAARDPASARPSAAASSSIARMKRVGQRLDRFAVLAGALDDLVVDVGDVANVGDVVAADARSQRRTTSNTTMHAGMTEVAVVVDGHAADVHAHFARHDAERTPASSRAERVVNREHAL